MAKKKIIPKPARRKEGSLCPGTGHFSRHGRDKPGHDDRFRARKPAKSIAPEIYFPEQSQADSDHPARRAKYFALQFGKSEL
ncbi:hypothetical protein JQ628_26680 [Bradyrhizobium lablabi]|uniref:hypothetical protein n=1 Tax=Bradyrhizobium lablabi TaxID=722472 RepID=UPI001BAC3A74|nr:hypothetical protein [Bradyrhizobium lablabi]MBR1125134.1 hypothetical protein [Bradyrhizobium lablabi]